jgi:hypothetical protein
MKRIVILIVLLWSTAVWGIAQTATAVGQAVQPAFLVVSSSPDSAWVYLETTFVGRTPCTIIVEQPTTRCLRVLHPDRADWLSGSVEDTIRFAPGGTIVRRYTLDRWTMVLSSPHGAEVFRGDSLLGKTPLVFPSGRLSPEVPLTLRKQGYDLVVVRLGQASRGILAVPLTASGVTGSAPDEEVLNQKSASSLRLYLAGGGAVLAGAAAAYFKIKADDRNSDYLILGDPALVSQRNRLDTTSAVFLAATEVSIGLFIVFLLSE